MPELQKLNVRLSHSELAEVQRTARLTHRSASAVCRQRITSSASPSFTPDSYRSCVEAVARSVPGLPRPQTEALVAIVVATLHQAQQ
jgi:hypothetical protein